MNTPSGKHQQTNKKRAAKPEPQSDGKVHPCSFPDCAEQGEYKAPLSPREVGKYRWLCLEHVREFNANWDYFAGMDAHQIEDFMRDAMYGHRPTWKINSQKLNATEEKLEEALARMMGSGHAEARRRVHARRVMGDKERKALATLDLSPEASLAEVKKRYKELVKKHHPDVNKGEKKAEERFKQITHAYQELMRARRKESST